MMKLFDLHLILDETSEIFGECCGSLRGLQSWISEKSTTIRSQHSDGLEELESTNRNDATPAPRRRLGLATIVPLDASCRQTELQREFPLHVVCSWLGNSPRIAQESYLLVTEDDFASGAGAKSSLSKYGISKAKATDWPSVEVPLPEAPITLIRNSIMRFRCPRTCITLISLNPVDRTIFGLFSSRLRTHSSWIISVQRAITKPDY